MISRIRKLLAQAEDAGVTPAEAELFRAKAVDLMAKYGIENLTSTAGNPDEMVIKEVEIALTFADVEARLFYYVAEALGCKAILTSTPEPGVSKVDVVGYLNDIGRAEVMFASLSLQMAAAVDRAFPKGARSTKSDRANWMMSWTTAVKDLLKAAEAGAAAAAEAETPGTALVLQERSVAVRTAFQKEYPNVTFGPSKYSYTPGGYAAGQSASLGKTAGVGNSNRTPVTAGRSAIGR